MEKEKKCCHEEAAGRTDKTGMLSVCVCVENREGKQAETGENKRGRRDSRSRDGPDL